MGEQFEITARRSRAVITEVGGGLRAFEVSGVPYVETFDASDGPPLGCGQILFPWPNRVAGGQWTLDGEQHRLEITEPARGNAIHGLVRHQPWELLERGSGWVTLGTEAGVQAGWPYPLYTTVTYEVDNWGLRVTHQVRNHGKRSVPFGLGVHPYPRPGNEGIADCDLQIAASSVLPLDEETMTPKGDPHAVGRTGLDLRRGRLICDLSVDHAYTGVRAGKDGIVRHSIVKPVPTPHGVELWAEKVFKWVQVFTADHFPAPRYFGVAIEPMTCPPNALSSGVDLINLAPGREWTGRWGIRPIHGDR
jgi:aldose 1-epimerase